MNHIKHFAICTLQFQKFQIKGTRWQHHSFKGIFLLYKDGMEFNYSIIILSSFQGRVKADVILRP